MKTTKNTLFVLLSVLMLTVISCSKEKIETPAGAYSNGFFVINEGPFQTGTGTVTFYDADSNKTEQDLFAAVNGRPLGNIAQSMSICNDRGYIIVNNAGKVEVVNISDFKSIATITDLVNPSQFLPVSSYKAYVSDWSGNIAVVDLRTNKVSSHIPAGTGPDAMLLSGNHVFVANTGGFTIDSTITVIDPATDQVVKTIRVGDAPNGIVEDREGRIWVMCKGNGFAGWPGPGDTEGRFVQIDPVRLEVVSSFVFPSTGDHPGNMVINRDRTRVYFLNGMGIFQMDLTQDLPVPAVFASSGFFYSLGYDRKTDYLCATDAGDYVSAGSVLRFVTATATPVDTLQAGIMPRGFAFPE
jgi:YVTN family beta-propeller protein